jgi:hypothetical protein
MTGTRDSVIAFGIALAIVRLMIGDLVEPDSIWLDVYKDVAHLYVGGLAGAWLYSREKWQASLFLVLNAVEVFAAITGRVF